MHLIKKLILALALILTASHSHSADWVGIGVSEKNLYSYDRGFIKRLKAEPSIRLTTLQLVPIKDTSQTKYVFTEVDCKYEMIRARSTTWFDAKTGKRKQEENLDPMWIDASDGLIIVKIVRSVCEAIPQ
jgi:hypothetical protein